MVREKTVTAKEEEMVMVVVVIDDKYKLKCIVSLCVVILSEGRVTPPFLKFRKTMTTTTTIRIMRLTLLPTVQSPSYAAVAVAFQLAAVSVPERVTFTQEEVHFNPVRNGAN